MSLLLTRFQNGDGPVYEIADKTARKVMTGADEHQDGKKGQVPKPYMSDREKFLRGDGKWAVVDLSDYVTMSTDQTITGDKTFLGIIFLGEDEEGTEFMIMDGDGWFDNLYSKGDNNETFERVLTKSDYDKLKKWVEDYYVLKSLITSTVSKNSDKIITSGGVYDWVASQDYLVASDASETYMPLSGGRFTGTVYYGTNNRYVIYTNGNAGFNTVLVYGGVHILNSSGTVKYYLDADAIKFSANSAGTSYTYYINADGSANLKTLSVGGNTVATQTWVNNQGYLTSHQSLSGYATQTWVNNQGYLTSHQSLSGYAKTSDIPTKTSQLTNDSGFLTNHQSLSNYLPLSAGAGKKLTGSLYFGSTGSYYVTNSGYAYFNNLYAKNGGNTFYSVSLSNHTHSGYLSTSGGTITGQVTFQSSGSTGMLYFYKTGVSGANAYISNEGWAEFYKLWVANPGSHSKNPVYMNDSGQICISSGSSKRWKTDIAPLRKPSISAEKLYDIKVVQFKYKPGYLDKDDPDNSVDIPGFIAENIDEVYPIAVAYDKEGLPRDWSERHIIPPMLKLIQDQHEEIEKLKEEMRRLKELINTIIL